MWTKQEQIITQKYLVKYLASCNLEQERNINTTQLHTLNTITIERSLKKKI